MRAVVAVQPNRVAFQTLPQPEPGPDEIVLRVLHSWISSGTEGSFLRGERIAGDTPRSANDPLPFPHVPGYQKVGVVEWMGENVTGFQPGEIVFATVSRVPGMFTSHGGHVSPAVTHRTQVWKLPAGVWPVAASGLVLTQVGYNTGMRPAIGAGQAAIVLGDGLVGHWTAQTLRHRGARVLLAGKHDERLERFPVGSGDRIVNVAREDLRAAVREWGGEGVQVVADTVGSVADVEALIPMMRRCGHISSAGFYGPNGRIDIQRMRDRELALHAPSGWSPERLSATLDLLAQGALTTEPLITHRFPAEQAADAFDLILSRREPFLGVVLDWE